MSLFTSDSRLSVGLFLWQLKAWETISTSLNACLALSDQTGSPFPLMWLSLRQTWWLGTRGVTMLAFTCAEPISRRPENLLPRPQSFMCLVESFYELNYLSSLILNFPVTRFTNFIFDASIWKVGINKMIEIFYMHISFLTHWRCAAENICQTLNSVTLFSDYFSDYFHI